MGVDGDRAGIYVCVCVCIPGIVWALMAVGLASSFKMFTGVCVCACVYTYIYIYTYMASTVKEFIGVLIYVCMHIYTYIHAHTFSRCLLVSTCIYICIYA